MPRRKAARPANLLEAHAMLKLIEGSYSSFFPKEMDAMFRNRAETFARRLGWDVVVNNGYERDRFDDLNPLYLVSVDPETERYRGSLRLLPTTGPNMLRDVFPQLLEEGEIVESAVVWEVSRICTIGPDGYSGRGICGVVLRELIAGIAEVGLIAGLFRIVAVFDERLLRILKAVRCNPEIIGRPQLIGGTMSFAALFGEDLLDGLCDSLAIDGSVLAPGAKELAFT